jgi:hypothetical protein
MNTYAKIFNKILVKKVKSSNEQVGLFQECKTG